MFDDLKQQLSNITARLSGRGFLSEKHINQACDEISDALLESDVGIDMIDKDIRESVSSSNLY